MVKPLTEKKRHNVKAMSAAERYSYFLQLVGQHELLWSLQDDKGCVVLSSEDGEECVPVWPHPEFAQDWIADEWSDCKLLEIDLNGWLQRWIPGMQQDGVAVAVFPGTDEDGVVMTPVELREEIEALLESKA